ncbi:MAG: biotin--[acetyl-CoA-carboxylase] ligase [Deltaproteobacteria bacterium]|jgi:BirA family biotin operon repressor/biotin-[acetyl-CoA-carboxylase] ligase|nr:biotin--[acetyl-CoA-carboxylase] ligase [Deltaproteobacteria bacterium]
MSASQYELWPLGSLVPDGPLVYQTGEVSSVLDVAWARLDQELATPWSSILAKSQTQGRGRFGRSWASPEGHVYAALRLPNQRPFEGTMASVALGYALAQAFRAEGVDVRLKWPNDLLTQEGKAGGILVENRRGALVAGLGLNLGQSPFPLELRDPLAPPPAAFPERLGPPADLWLRLAKNLFLRYNDDFLAKDPDWARTFSSLAEKSLLGLGQKVTIHEPVAEPRVTTPHLTGILTGLAPSGALIIEGPLGEVAVWAGTLTWPNRARDVWPQN